MCIYCETNKSIENHRTRGIFVKVCKDCAIMNGYRTVEWYEDNKEFIASAYGINNWEDI
jgi:hypothetical protein